MRMTPGIVSRSLLLVILPATMCVSSVVNAATNLRELVADNQLRASVGIETQGELYQRAPFFLSVEIATARWFSRGTQVRDLRIPGAVVRPVSTFADNSSRRIEGETWSVQRWRFRVFPQDAGLLAIPGLRVFISVNTATDGAVEGDLLLDGTSAQIIPPPGVARVSTWIATPSLTIEQRWEGLMDSFIAGDAITRTRSFVAQDAPGMMIEASDVDEIAGLSFYEAPSTVLDESHRGTLTGTREESVVVTFETPGRYQIPGLDYVWFNTETGTLETLSLPALNVEVIAAEAATPAKKRRLELPMSSPILLGSGVALLIVILLWAVRSTTLSRQLRKTLNTRFQQKRSYANYLQALRQKNSGRCIQLLYEQLTKSGSQRQLHDALLTHKTYTTQATGTAQIPEHSLRQLLEHAYGEGNTIPDRRNARELWRAITQSSTEKSVSGALSLNPMSS
ncbi:hypothetical protein [Congregibacter sp.]|jgi:hypothetical protein|uniref:hypothetical protein n=1 Tax=Congregibacter sp. TaxID=2744308 RepID=UPI0039E5B4C2